MYEDSLTIYETIMKKHGLEDMFKRLEEARAK